MAEYLRRTRGVQVGPSPDKILKISGESESGSPTRSLGDKKDPVTPPPTRILQKDTTRNVDKLEKKITL